MAVMRESFIGRILVRNLTWCFIALPALGCGRSFTRAILVRGTGGPMRPTIRDRRRNGRAVFTRGSIAHPSNTDDVVPALAEAPGQNESQTAAAPLGQLRLPSPNWRASGTALKPSCAPHQNRPAPPSRDRPRAALPTAPCPHAEPPRPCASAPRCSAHRRRPAPHACA